MYVPKVFAEAERSRWRALVEAHGFGTLVAVRRDASPEIAHLPFLLEPGEPFGRLRAHVARANPFATMLDDAPRVTVVFHGPHAYVTPRWYESPTEQVPTWNYAVVHARGVARPLDDRAEVRRALADLAAKYESDAAAPWTVDQIDPAFFDKLAGAVRAFAIEVEEVEAKWKMSQNRSDADQRRVVEGLLARVGGTADDVGVAKWMQILRNAL